MIFIPHAPQPSDVVYYFSSNLLFFFSETNSASLFISKMMSVLAVAPYAIGVLSFTFIYFLALPYVEYLRDPKGMFENSLATKLFN